MVPKFKGEEDEWLDSEESSYLKKKNIRLKKGKSRGEYLGPGLANATVSEVFPNQCAVVLDRERVRWMCSYRKARLPQSETRERAPVVVGDRVHVEPVSPLRGIVDGLEKRKNELVRPSPDRSSRHVLVANIDCLVVVASVLEPEFSPGLVDRFLIAAEVQKIRPVLCVTKIDLKGERETLWERFRDLYRSLGVLVYEVSSKTGEGLAELEGEIRNQWTVFSGHSGVGKTTLLNALTGEAVGKTGSVNSMTGKGRHTTTGAYLIAHSKKIDTPGIRSFGLVGVAANRLRDFFPEFKAVSCHSRGCLHLKEKDCQAQGLLRYMSYQRILESLLSEEEEGGSI